MILTTPGLSGMPGGRPSTYSQEIAEEICQEISRRPRGVAALCREHGHWPDPSTVFDWLNKHPEFAERYARAKTLQSEVLADEILDIADDGLNDWIEVETRRGAKKIVLDKEHVQRSRLRVDTRLRLLSKLAPKKWGDKVQHEVGGPSGGPLELDMGTLLNARREIPDED